MKGYKNIDPHCGKKFTSEYQPDKEIWTEEISVRFLTDMIEWLKEKDDEGDDKGNIFYEEFILLVADPKKYHEKAKIYHELPSYLGNKFTSCLKLIEKAKEIQRIKLIKYGVADRLNASMTKFVLMNNHGMTDKTDVTTKGKAIGPQIIMQDVSGKTVAEDEDNDGL